MFCEMTFHIEVDEALERQKTIDVRRVGIITIERRYTTLYKKKYHFIPHRKHLSQPKWQLDFSALFDLPTHQRIAITTGQWFSEKAYMATGIAFHVAQPRYRDVECAWYFLSFAERQNHGRFQS